MRALRLRSLLLLASVVIALVTPTHELVANRIKYKAEPNHITIVGKIFIPCFSKKVEPEIYWTDMAYSLVSPDRVKIFSFSVWGAIRYDNADGIFPTNVMSFHNRRWHCAIRISIPPDDISQLSRRSPVVDKFVCQRAVVLKHNWSFVVHQTSCNSRHRDVNKYVGSFQPSYGVLRDGSRLFRSTRGNLSLVSSPCRTKEGGEHQNQSVLGVPKLIVSGFSLSLSGTCRPLLKNAVLLVLAFAAIGLLNLGLGLIIKSNRKIGWAALMAGCLIFFAGLEIAEWKFCTGFGEQYRSQYSRAHPT